MSLKKSDENGRDKLGSRFTVASLASKANVSSTSVATPTKSNGKKAPTSDEIAKRAWEIWMRKGCKPGGELENWLEAEKELGR